MLCTSPCASKTPLLVAAKEPYGFDERCTLTVPEGTVVTVTSFETEDFYDRLTINGERYSGPHGLEGTALHCVAELLAAYVLSRMEIR